MANDDGDDDVSNGSNKWDLYDAHCMPGVF